MMLFIYHDEAVSNAVSCVFDLGCVVCHGAGWSYIFSQYRKTLCYRTGVRPFFKFDYLDNYGATDIVTVSR